MGTVVGTLVLILPVITAIYGGNGNAQSVANALAQAFDGAPPLRQNADTPPQPISDSKAAPRNTDAKRPNERVIIQRRIIIKRKKKPSFLQKIIKSVEALVPLLPAIAATNLITFGKGSLVIGLKGALAGVAATAAGAITGIFLLGFALGMFGLWIALKDDRKKI